jgi:hypothetical protein
MVESSRVVEVVTRGHVACLGNTNPTLQTNVIIGSIHETTFALTMSALTTTSRFAKSSLHSIALRSTPSAGLLLRRNGIGQARHFMSRIPSVVPYLRVSYLRYVSVQSIFVCIW